jgi:hypothetical protein
MKKPFIFIKKFLKVIYEIIKFFYNMIISAPIQSFIMAVLLWGALTGNIYVKLGVIILIFLWSIMVVNSAIESIICKKESGGKKMSPLKKTILYVITMIIGVPIYFLLFISGY